MSRQRTAAATALALWPSPHQAGAGQQIYKITDDEKGVVFTDRPESDQSESQQVEKVELPNVNTVPRVEPAPARQAPSKSAAAPSR
jgi:hypothetical protein